MFDCNAFGERLRQARINAGLTMTQAGNKVYISQCTISRYESGEVTPTIDRVCALAKLYGCSIDWLCGNDGVTVIINEKILGNAVKGVKL